MFIAAPFPLLPFLSQLFYCSWFGRRALAFPHTRALFCGVVIRHNMGNRRRRRIGFRSRAPPPFICVQCANISSPPFFSLFSTCCSHSPPPFLEEREHKIQMRAPQLFTAPPSSNWYHRRRRPSGPMPSPSSFEYRTRADLSLCPPSFYPLI